MSTVTLRPDRLAGQTMTDLFQALKRISGAEPVRSGGGGAVVSEQVALTYLADKHSRPRPALSPPAPVTLAATAPAVTELVSRAEGRGGLTRPRPAAKRTKESR